MLKLVVSFAALFTAAAAAQPDPGYAIDKSSRVPRFGGHVVTAFADDDDTPVDTRRCCSTGELHIVYNNGAEVLIRLNRTDSDGPADFSNIKVAPDRQAVGWTQGFYTGAAYSDPRALNIVRRGKPVLHATGKGVIWYWEFVAGGRQAAAIFGPPRATDCGDHVLYDLQTHMAVADRASDLPALPCLKQGAPPWAVQLEQDYQAMMQP